MDMKKYSGYAIFTMAALLSMGILAGCGEQKAPEVTTAVSSENIPAQAAVPSAGEGVIKGKVLFSGTAPEAVKLDLGADPVCAGAHSDGLLSETLTVNANGTLRDAFVYVKSGLPSGVSYPVPAEAVVMDQKGCRYTPHVFGVQVNQPVTIVNSDGTLHNVHAQLKNSKEFNLGMPIQGMKMTKKFPQPEVMAHFKCDVHPWMSAYAGVLDHPFFAVTGEDGSFEIKGLPAGQYTLEVWQEKLGTQTAAVDVPVSGEVTAEVTFTA